MIHQSNLAPAYECHFCPSCGYNIRRDEDVTVGSLSVGLLTGARWRGISIRLSPQQLYALHTIASAKGKLVRHETIENRCDCTHEHVKVLVSNIKKAVRRIDPTFNRITNEWGVGYRWREA